MKLLRRTLLFLSFSLVLTIPPSTASVADIKQQLQIPICLADHLPLQYPTLAINPQYKIIEVPITAIDDIRRISDEVDCGRFMNITASLTHKSWNATQWLQNVQSSRGSRLRKSKLALVSDDTHREDISYPLQHKEEVSTLLKAIDPQNIWNTVLHLSNYTNRSARQPSGLETALWLKTQFEQMSQQYGRLDTDTFLVASGRSYPQPSVVTVIGKELPNPAIVIGAHMDTLGKTPEERMPGAGDDASGSATVLEIARVLLSSPQSFKHPIYIIWYAAEEQGLVGSQKVVDHFLKKSIAVSAAIQFDMTGYRPTENDPTIWLYEDFTDPKLTGLLKNLIEAYIHVPVGFSSCGYGCSDHAAWALEGVPTAFPSESSFTSHNPYIHTASDTVNLLNIEHMTHFTELGLAFAVELASR